MKIKIKKTLIGIFLTGFLLGLVTSAQAKEILIGETTINCSLHVSGGQLYASLEIESTGNILPTRKSIWNRVEGCAVGDAFNLTLEMKNLVENLDCIAGNIRDKSPSLPEPDNYGFPFTCKGNKQMIINVLDDLLRFVLTIQPISVP